MTTLLKFWNDYEVDRIFVVGLSCPGGTEYHQNLDENSDDYCSLRELIDSGLFGATEDGSQPQWELEGTLQLVGTETVWQWDGQGSICDHNGNNWRRIDVTGH